MKKEILLMLIIFVLFLSGCNSAAEYELLDTCERVPYNTVWNQKGIFEFQFLDIKEIPLTTLENSNNALDNISISESAYNKILENNAHLFQYSYSLNYCLDDNYAGPNNPDDILYYAISCCTADKDGNGAAMVNGVGGLNGIETGNLMHPGDSCIKTVIFTCEENELESVENLRFNVNIYRNSSYQYRREFMYTIP